MPNIFDDADIDTKGFAYRDILGLDRWDPYTVTASTFISGNVSTVGRFRLIGKECQFQVALSASVSVSSTAGVHFVNLPTVAKGLGGIATMTDATTKVAVGICHIEVSTTPGRVYLPTQAASGDIFKICGRYEVA